MARVVRRTLRRGLLRTELWHGNRENLRNVLNADPDQNVVLWSWTSHARNRTRYSTLAARVPDPGDPPAQPARGEPLAGPGAGTRRAPLATRRPAPRWDAGPSR